MKRLNKLRLKLAELGIESLLVSKRENILYLSGFDGSAGFLIIGKERNILATDSRYLEQAGEQAPDFEIYKINNSIKEWLPALALDLEISGLGFEVSDITFGRYQEIENALKIKDISLVPTKGIVEDLRLLKEADELKNIEEAVRISDAAFEDIMGKIDVGMTEEEVAWEIENYMRQRGSQPLPFYIIVASGPNSARPHMKPTKRRIKEGEPVIMDFGARINGYGSDLSRTICLGEPDDSFVKIYNSVLKAQQAAIEGIKDGMNGSQADAIARQIISKRGYGENFIHSLGHGLGIEPHESPRLGPGSEDTLENGMIFTIEPGIYIPGWGGVRIEDTVIMEYGKIRVLSRAKKIKY